MKSIDILKSLLDNEKYCEIVKKDADGNDINVVIKKNEPIKNSELISPLLNLLPEEYVELLSFSNGMELFNYDDIDGVKLLSLQEIDNYTGYGKNTFEEDWDDNVIFFAKIIGEDNYLGFRKKESTYEVIDCYFEELPLEWITMEEKLDDFLEKYIASNGEKFWIS